MGNLIHPFIESLQQATLSFTPKARIPLPWFKSIPYSQYLRLKRNYSRDSDFKIAARDLYNRLKTRGYSHTCLKKAFNRANEQNRNSLIFSNKQIKKPDNVRVITQYSCQHQQFRCILKKFWPLLVADPTVSKHINNIPEVTFKRAPSLRDRLVRSHFRTTQPSSELTNCGTFPLRHMRCMWICCYRNQIQIT